MHPLSQQKIPAMKSAVHRKKHLLYAELDAWRQVDDGIISSGYQHLTASWLQSFLAIFHRPHNQTVNILSHLFGAICISLVVIVLAFELHHHPEVLDKLHRCFDWPATIFYTSAFGCLTLSVIFHISTSHSEPARKLFLSFDYVGIILLIVGTYWPTVYYAFICQPWIWLTYNTLVGILGSIAISLVTTPRYSSPQYRKIRTYTFLSLAFSELVPICHTFALHGSQKGSRALALPLHAAGCAFYVLGAFIYSHRFPERYAKPGTFDIYGSSHQIMHLCVLGGIFMHHHALREAAAFRHGSSC